MQRVFEIETSQYSDSPTKRWVGQDYCVESVCLEYPPELDNLDDEVLLDMADNLEGGVVYASLPNTACTRLRLRLGRSAPLAQSVALSSVLILLNRRAGNAIR